MHLESTVTVQAFSPLVADPRPAPVTAFDRVLHEFLVDDFHAHPSGPRGSATTSWTIAGRTSRRPDGGPGSRCSTALARRSARRLTPMCRTASGSIAPSCWSSWTSSASVTRCCATKLGSAPSCTCGQRPVRAAVARVRALERAWCRIHSARRAPARAARGQPRGSDGPVRPTRVAPPPRHRTGPAGGCPGTRR